jgi:hypothetical protein
MQQVLYRAGPGGPLSAFNESNQPFPTKTVGNLGHHILRRLLRNTLAFLEKDTVIIKRYNTYWMFFE